MLTVVRNRRFELRMLLIVLIFGLAICLMAQIGLHKDDTPVFVAGQMIWLLPVLAYGFALFGASLLIGWRRPRTHKAILPLIGLLGMISLMLIYRVPTPFIEDGVQGYFAESDWYLNRHLRSLLLGLLLLTIIVVMPYNLIEGLRKYRMWVICGSIGLLFVTAFFGVPANPNDPNSPRVALDLFLLTFQTSELIKLAFVIYLASYFADVDLGGLEHRFSGLFRFLRYMLPIAIFSAVVLAALLLMSDLGVVLVLFIVFPVMVFAALRKQIMQLIAGIIVVGILGVYLWTGQIGRENEQGADFWTALLTAAEGTPMEGGVTSIAVRIQARTETWSDPVENCSDVYCPSYQTLQGLYAVAAGGLLGEGLGNGNIEYIPFVHTDFIFAALAEEWGFIGSVIVLGLYLAFIRHGLQIAEYQEGTFSYLLGVGIVTIFVAQLFIIIGGTLNLIPFTGITVPFLSYGGSSILINSVMVGLLLRLSQSGNPNVNTHMEQRIDLIEIGVYTLFGALVIALAYWMLWKSPALNANFSTENEYANTPAAIQRQNLVLDRIERGRILANDGTILADNTVDGRIHDPSLIHTVGYADQFGRGLSGIEEAFNDQLLGRRGRSLRTIWAQMSGGNWRGQDVVLTIDPAIQSAADTALGGYTGSVVVLDAESGAVLAMVSHPTFIPGEKSNAADSPQLNRSINGVYPPGSTFKTVVATAALDNNITTPDTVYDYTADEWFYNDEFQIWCHERTVYTLIRSCNTNLREMTLTEGYAWSDNVLFAELAVDLEGEAMWKHATSYGFNREMQFDLSLTPSSIAPERKLLDDPAELASTGYGQARVSVTPLQMALVVAAVANDGTLPQPHLVTSGSTRFSFSSGTRVMSEETAVAMQTIMQAGVEEGWGWRAAVPNVRVGGKTGTADWTDPDEQIAPHSWFIGFAEYEEQTVAIAVLAEKSGNGSTVAAPIAGQILNAIP